MPSGRQRTTSRTTDLSTLSDESLKNYCKRFNIVCEDNREARIKVVMKHFTQYRVEESKAIKEFVETLGKGKHVEESKEQKDDEGEDDMPTDDTGNQDEQ